MPILQSVPKNTSTFSLSISDEFLENELKAFRINYMLGSKVEREKEFLMFTFK